MYDSNKVPTLEDCGSYCPQCGESLLFSQAEPVAHSSGDGLSWQCRCGAKLHENQHSYVFSESGPTPVRRYDPKPVKVRHIQEFEVGRA